MSLNWVQDGIDPLESKALGWVAQIPCGACNFDLDRGLVCLDNAGLASSVVSLGWVEDGIDSYAEVSVIAALEYIGGKNAELASSVVSLVWVQDALDSQEAEVLDRARYDVISNPLILRVFSLGWVQDGISSLEAEVLDWARLISNPFILRVFSLGWVQDGIDNEEAVDTIRYLYLIAEKDATLGESVISLGWVQDGTDNDVEVNTILSLLLIAQEDAPLAESVVSLGWVQDGIDDDVEATLWAIVGRNPGFINVLLDPDRLMVEQRTITFASGGGRLACHHTHRSGGDPFDGPAGTLSTYHRGLHGSAFSDKVCGTVVR